MSLMNRLAVVALAMSAFCLPSISQAQDKLRVAMPQRGTWDTGLVELGQRGGIFKKHGIDIELLFTQAGPESIQALIAGSVDIVVGSGVGAAVGAISKGAPIRIFSSEIIGAPDQYWYVPANSPIRKIADLNGKTISFSQPGSSSNANLIALMSQYKLDAKPVSTGSIASTLTQTLTGQIDVGFSAVPFFLDKVETGEIRIIATGEELASLKTRTGRVNIATLAILQTRRDLMVRFLAAYRETLDWMYADPAALVIFQDITQLPRPVIDKIRTLMPKATMVPDRVIGLDQIAAEALAGKFITTPLSTEQVEKMIDVPLK